MAVPAALILTGTSEHQPSLSGSATGTDGTLAYGLQEEKGYKNSLQAYVLPEYLHKACVQS